MTDGIRSQGIRKSLFPAQSVVLSDATFDYVAQGANFKITFTDLVGQLGVTGTIVQVGDPAGTPVLDTQGTVNGIRNLEDGAGIVTQVSAQNGITVASGMTQDGTAVPLIADLATTTPDMASLRAGTGINIVKTNNVIDITNTTPANVNPNVVVVLSVSDLGTDTGTAYQLDDDTDYEITGTDSAPIVVDKPVIPGNNNSFFSPNLNNGKISVTTTDPFLQITNKGFGINNIQITGPSSSTGQLFDVSNTVGVSFVLCANFLASSFGSLGSVNTGAGALVLDGWNFFSYGAGLSLDGSGGTLDIMRGGAFFGAAASTCFDLGTGDWGRISFRDNKNNLPAATFLDGAANGANITNGSIIGEGIYADNIFNGAGGTEVATITSADTGWVFDINADIADSAVLGQISSGAFTISSLVLNTPQLVDPSTTLGASERTDMPANGRLRHTGRRPEKVKIKFSLTGQTSSGTNTMNFAIVKNGNSGSPLFEDIGVEVKSTTDVLFVVESFDILSEQDDYYELWVETTNSTNNIAVSNYSAIINKV